MVIFTNLGTLRRYYCCSSELFLFIKDNTYFRKLKNGTSWQICLGKIISRRACAIYKDDGWGGEEQVNTGF